MAHYLPDQLSILMEIYAVRLSNIFSSTYKEAPREAELINHQLLLRAGMIHQYGAGIFGMLPLGHRCIQKITQIVREEMNLIDSQEISMTGAVPKDIWEETGRYEAIDNSMFRLEDRHGQKLVLNMTHEEPVVDMVRHIINSYKQLPFSTYQFQTKFRDEARPRGGLIRLREFIMKDAYSFHTNEDDLKQTYNKFFAAYVRIFKKIGFKNFIDVASDNGMFGGNYSHEFMLITDSGEDTLMLCNKCDYKANKEIASSGHNLQPCKQVPEMQKTPTPSQKTIEDLCTFLGLTAAQTAKAVLFQTIDDSTPVICFLRGDLNVMQLKVESAIGRALTAAGEAAIKSSGAVAGSAGPLDLNYKESIVILDPTVAIEADYCTGANEEGFHYTHFNPKRDFLDTLSSADKAHVKIIDIATANAGDPCPNCTAPLVAKRGIEIGNIFHLGSKYTKSMGFTYLDQNGKTQHPIMGCYGLGITRALGSIVEEQHDESGMILPITIAPFDLLLMVFNYKKPEVKEAAEKLYKELKSLGIDVVIDDRDKKPGFQFKDADLIGVPVRAVISPKLMELGQIEISLRTNPREKSQIPFEQAQSTLLKMVKDEYSKYEQ
jgi:prolyl-tRNA synthetase